MANQNASNPDTNIAELVNEHINNLDDKGKLQLPEDMAEWQKHVIRSEKRQRDAQSELSKTKSQLKEEQAAKLVLLDAASSIIPSNFQLSEEEIAELEAIKFQDPDTYRIRVNELEAKAKKAQEDNLTDLTTKAVEDVRQSNVSNNRLAVLEEFRLANPNTQLTDDVLVNDVPPRFMNDLNSGKYDYSTYLVKVAEYLNTGKVIPNSGSAEDKSLGDVSGGLTPGKDAANKAGKQDYKKMTF